MEYAQMRELVRLRHELRRLTVERPAGADAAARAILLRIQELVAADVEEAAQVAPELARWQITLDRAAAAREAASRPTTPG